MTTAHVYQLYVRADLDEVWRAIVDPEFTRQYFFGSAFAEPPAAGVAYTSVLPDGSVAVDGVIEEFDPPHRLVQTWHVRYDPALAAEPVSRVTWTLEQAGEGLVRLRVTHGDLALSPLTWASVKNGWVYVLDGLKSLVETGSPLPPRYDDEAPSDAEQVYAQWHRWQAVEANNATMTLLDDAAPHPDEALRGAYAAAYHWDRVPSKQPVNEVRALYVIGKAWWRAGRPELALDHAERMLTTCAEAGIDDFDLAYAHELRGRALAALGRPGEADAARAAARAVPIADPEDAAILAADLAR